MIGGRSRRTSSFGPVAASATFLLLSISAMTTFGTGPGSRADGPDLYVVDIWPMDDWGVKCKIGMTGGDLSGSFFVNLSFWGEHQQSYTIYWMPDGNGTMDVTFEAYAPWNGTMVIVGIELDFSPSDNEQNASNNQRTERWFRDLPDLYVRSVYMDQTTGNATALIGNKGMGEAGPSFAVGLWVNESRVDTRQFYEPMPTGALWLVGFDWTWDTDVSFVMIGVAVDPSNWIEEVDERNNVLNITWERKERFLFTEPPKAASIGQRNATISWSTSTHASCLVRYGKSTADMRSAGPTASSEHGSIQLSNLTPMRQYIFEVLAFDGSGREHSSGIRSFTTGRPSLGAPPRISFTPGPIRFGKGVGKIPCAISDDLGVQRVDMYIDGELAKTIAGMGGQEIAMLDHDFSIYEEGDHRMTLVATDEGGNSFSLSSDFQMVVSTMDSMEVRITTPSDCPVTAGVLGLDGTCTHHSGFMANATWYIDGVEVARTESSGLTRTINAHHDWLTVDYINGPHTVMLRATSTAGETREAEEVFNVLTIVEPGDPFLIVQRGQVERTGSLIVSHLTLANAGGGLARDIVLGDVVFGFVPLDGDEGTRSIGISGAEWLVARKVDLLPPGSSLDVAFTLIPAFNYIDNYEIGLLVLDPFGGSSYTTQVTYSRLDRAVSYELRTTLPQGCMWDGNPVETAVRSVQASSDYMMITCPQAMYSRFPGRDSTEEVLLEAAHLLEIREGVFGLVGVDLDHGLIPTTVRSYLENWAGFMCPAYPSEGYLAILGEDEIVPACDYPDVPTAKGSDHWYSTIGGTDFPELIVGRFLGRTPEELLVTLGTAIGVAEGILVNDHTGAATLVTSAGEGAQTFQHNGEDLKALLDPLMDDVRLYTRGQSIVRRSFDVEFDGVRDHMAAGDLDYDGIGEVVVISPGEDEITVIDSRDGSRESYAFQMEQEDIVLIGDIYGYGAPRKEILIAQEVQGEGRIRVLDTSCNLLMTSDPGWEIGDPISAVDFDRDGFDDYVIGSIGTNRMKVTSAAMSVLFQMDLTYEPLTSESMLDLVDIDYDGTLDVCHHDPSRRIRDIYYSSNRRDDRRIIDEWVDGNDIASGPVQNNGTDGLIHIQREIDTISAIALRNDRHNPDNWMLRWDNFFLPVEGPCGADVMELGNVEGPYEIAVCAGAPENRLFFLDYGHEKQNFQGAVAPSMVDCDLLFFRDHGEVDEWCNLFFEDELSGIGIGEGTHRPVVFSSACMTGRYHDNDTSFARSFMLNGGGVFIGATMISYRATNNEAISMIEDWARGTPIGAALKSFKMEMVDGDMLWVREYNLYGDPAFGVLPGQVACFKAPIPREPGPRSVGPNRLDLGPLSFRNVAGGLNASFPGSRPCIMEGRSVVPYSLLTYDIPINGTVSSVNVSMEGGWEYLEDIEIPTCSSNLTDALTFGGTRAGPDAPVDPGDPWYPVESFEWSEYELPDGNGRLFVRLYPFQYDRSSMTARYCRNWSIDIEISERVARIGWMSGPNWTVSLGGKALLEALIEPVGGGGEVSITAWVEDGAGLPVRELGSTVLLLNSTTHLLETWNSSGSETGPYRFMVELRSGSGKLLGVRGADFFIGKAMARISDIYLPDTTFDGGSPIEAWTTVVNMGETEISGSLRISIFTEDYWEQAFMDLEVGIAPKGELNLSASFRTSDLASDSYLVLARLSYPGGSDSLGGMISREGIPPVESPSLINNFTLNALELLEGDDLFINGTIHRSDGLIMRNISVSIRLNDSGEVVMSRTDEEGKYGLVLLNLPSGNWTVSVYAYAGEMALLSTAPVSVGERPEDNTTPTDDDDVEDDDNDDDGPDDDAQDSGDDGGDGASHLFFIIVPLAAALILVAATVAVLFVLRKRTTGLADWEE